MVTEGISFEDLPVDNSHKKDQTTNETVQETLDKLEEKKRNYLKIAPKKDSDVIRILELIEEPTMLREETVEERRKRLATILFVNRDSLKKYYKSELYLNCTSENGTTTNDGSLSDVEDQENQSDEDEFYTPASSQLLSVRRFLVKDSIERARKRIRNEKQFTITNTQSSMIKSRRERIKVAQHFELEGSQVISKRPISRVSISAKSKYFAAGSWGGDIVIQHVKTLERIVNIEEEARGKIGGLDWNRRGNLLVSGSEDSTVRLHEFNESCNSLKELFTLKGHEGRVAHVKFHPTDNYIASASFDNTWRLWDVETGSELLLQEGHNKEVYSIDFQNDGSLLCSGGLDNIGLVWDVRAGKSIMELKGHTKPVYSVQWCPNAYQVATGGGDGLINIWDIRNTKKASEILAHKNIVTDISVTHDEAPFLISCGYDKTINIYSADNWAKINTLVGHADKVLTANISKDGKYIVSGGWDRSVKLWENHA
ncbi:similar to Saccharomyces cerevisiae YPR178W PRP4 Splicing factor, component of the U4/U6-U5 snRNP complex [Maudiozyma barnettii]|uniref:Similar to Saccharomyces cerevisiae YPR178W PRP4 Splicing factor, component of the U4/U6-U5 snRNP complex n=1 Tax=Maudiozyma barnettii TaxID=61262 RepID=A0A8H2VEC0_9SACH|nr:U4/U6-U5 snRNP complex subunit PRP4 [Kazachstania barnettii]CAB4253915.1 similar to Saccharomyces cerevisiae YPR178W PRP4 Splicing factor, component of the U4/U6-U5 snRNP complex [Kazachstania barnettii]CAD1781665.1 similar to Saccharomyces cerevisiae YPR178W PRP4 Splicing factor, component of the U4/U6-U5 snRNP complex [Kazachstania barnettii]